MQVAVRYFTRSGNTERLAHAVAEAAGVSASPISTPLTEKADLLFLGWSYYAFDMDKEVKAFLAENKENIGTVACFGTSAMMKSMKGPMKKVCRKLSISFIGEFHCPGEFKFANKGRPNEEDLCAAAAFVKQILEKADE